VVLWFPGSIALRSSLSALCSPPIPKQPAQILHGTQNKRSSLAQRHRAVALQRRYHITYCWMRQCAVGGCCPRRQKGFETIFRATVIAPTALFCSQHLAQANDLLTPLHMRYASSIPS
jgi:hypothetical protein